MIRKDVCGSMRSISVLQGVVPSGGGCTPGRSIRECGEEEDEE